MTPSAASPVPAQSTPTPTVSQIPAPTQTTTAAPAPQQSSQPSDAIQKAMEATLASISLPPAGGASDSPVSVAIDNKQLGYICTETCLNILPKEWYLVNGPVTFGMPIKVENKHSIQLLYSVWPAAVVSIQYRCPYVVYYIQNAIHR